MDARAWNWKFQVFRSRALIATKPKTETRVAGVIQIRSSTEVVVAPYLALNTASDFEHILFECLELVHVPDKLLAQDLMHQLLVFSTNLFGRDPHHSYVILINIKRKRKGEEVKYTYPDDDRFFEKMKAEEVKANLLTVRGIFIVQKSCRMNEVNAVAKTCRRDDLDVEIECPICLGEMDLGDEYVQTPCKHTYHTGCLGRWLVCTYNKLLLKTMKKLFMAKGGKDESGQEENMLVQENNARTTCAEDRTNLGNTSRSGQAKHAESAHADVQSLK